MTARAQSARRTAGPWRTLPAAARHPLRFVLALIDHIRADDVLTISAAMAYYFFLSLFPLVVFVLAVVSLLPVLGLEDWLLARAAPFVPAEAYRLIETTIRALLDRPRSGLLSLGALLALWTASSAFVSVMDGLTRAYGVPEYRPWWRVRLQALALTLALSVFLIVTFVLTAFGSNLAALVGRALGRTAELASLVVSWTIVVGAVTVVVAAIDYACPARPLTWRWVTPGSVVFMLGFAVTSSAFSYYVGHFASYDATYGALGAVIVLLLWMYFLAFFLLVGGEVNALLERMAREREAAAEVAPAPAEVGERLGESVS